MIVKHAYLYSDACPTDWLVDGQDKQWHTIVNWLVPTQNFDLPAVEGPDANAWGILARQKMDPHMILGVNTPYTRFVRELQDRLPDAQLRKWKTGPSYRGRFCSAFREVAPRFGPILAACSFQEEVLRESKEALLAKYNQLIGGMEGRGIGFAEFPDSRGRPRMAHEFLAPDGYHMIQGLENQLLVILLMTWFIADQYIWFHKFVRSQNVNEPVPVALTVVSDRLSGDNRNSDAAAQCLKNLLDPDRLGLLVLMHSPQADCYPGDLIVDNVAGWLNAAITDTTCERSQSAQSLRDTGLWNNWLVLQPSLHQLSFARGMRWLERS